MYVNTNRWPDLKFSVDDDGTVEITSYNCVARKLKTIHVEAKPRIIAAQADELQQAITNNDKAQDYAQEALVALDIKYVPNPLYF